MAKVFISYARKDKDEVYPIVDMLEKNGIDCWIDKDGIESGDKFKKNIIKAINECQVFLYMLSPNSVKSEWVAKEHEHANRKSKVIIPIFLSNLSEDEDVFDEVMFDFGGVDYVDTGKEGWKDRLLRSVKKHCGIEEETQKQKILKEETQNLEEKLPNEININIIDEKLVLKMDLHSSKKYYYTKKESSLKKYLKRGVSLDTLYAIWPLPVSVASLSWKVVRSFISSYIPETQPTIGDLFSDSSRLSELEKKEGFHFHVTDDQILLFVEDNRDYIVKNIS